MLPLLTALLFVTVWRRSTVAYVLLANWTLNTAFCYFTAETTPLLWFIVIDYLSGFLIVMGGLRTTNFMIAGTFAIQCVIHGARGYVGSGADLIYWDALYVVAWLQVLLAGYRYRSVVRVQSREAHL